MSHNLQHVLAADEIADSVTRLKNESVATTTATIRFLATEQEWSAPQVQHVWRELLATTANPNALFASPEWFENKHKTKRETLRVAVVEDGGEIIGIAPLLIGEQEFDLKLCRMRLKTAQILGGEGLVQRQEVYEPLFKAIFQAFDVAAIHFRLLSTESPCWKAVQSSRAGLVHIQDRFKLYIVDLPQTFDAYLATRFDSKHRANLRRRVKVLGEQGQLRLQRITVPEDVPEFLRIGGQVARASWQAASADYLIQETPQWSAHLSDLARRGLLRCYILWCGSRPCAYRLGFQGRGYYFCCFAGYDPAMAKFSPGTVILMLTIEDLIQHDSPGKLNFGEGEDEYKRHFASSAIEVANVTMLRPSITSCLRLTGFEVYRSFRALKRWGKHFAGNARGRAVKRLQPGQAAGESQEAERRTQRQHAAMQTRRPGMDPSRAFSSAQVRVTTDE